MEEFGWVLRMIGLRSFLFNVLYAFWTVLIAIVGIPWQWCSLSRRLWVQRCWSKGNLWLLRCIVGLDYRADGVEQLPSGPYIIAARHESAWETFAFFSFFPLPCFILKHSLLWIPFVNLYFWRGEMIAIRREGHAATLRLLLRLAQDRVRRHPRSIVIFPQGTRVAPNEAGVIQPGVLALYRHLNIQIVPVVHDAGRYWPKNGWLKRPGTIRLRVLPAIDPGLPRKEVAEILAQALQPLPFPSAKQSIGGE
jgi:1-acyl-sn-glycerol-3-phosphate acyltransferase